MPKNLDAHTRHVIFNISICSISLLSVSSLYAQLVVIPKLLKNRRNRPSPWDARPPLFPLLLCSLFLMALASAVLTLPIVAFGPSSSSIDTGDSSGGDVPSNDLFHRELSSSINFCEDDFQDSDYIAEPANTASSIASYCPLALLGLFGPPSTEWSTRVAGNARFAVAYVALFAIGVGSTMLHALLTAKAQGGDELPMLWFMAALSFCAIDIIIQGKWGPVQKDSRKYLQLIVSTSAVMATCIYVFSRDSFLHFYIMFAIYSYIATVGVIVICFNLKWNDDDFQANVLLPLGVSSAWVAVLAVVSWVAEMLFCDDVKTWTTFTVAPWIWNRAVHPLWHISSALLAWLLTQILIAAQGLQHGWGEPRLKWFGAPYVTFYKPQQHHLKSK